MCGGGAAGTRGKAVRNLPYLTLLPYFTYLSYLQQVPTALVSLVCNGEAGNLPSKVHEM